MEDTAKKMFEAMAPLPKEAIDGALQGIKEDVVGIPDQGLAKSLAISQLQQGGASKSTADDVKDDLGAEPKVSKKDDDWQGAPRFAKLEFLTFDGSEDALPWLTRVEQFFEGQGTPERGKTWLASYHLSGRASLWYRHLKRAQGAPPWRVSADN
jgi:hypothetical protein